MKFLALAVLLIPSLLRADCGDQSYVWNPAAIPAAAMRRAIAVVEFAGEPDEDSERIVVSRDEAGTRREELGYVQTTPVSLMPTCNGHNGFDGAAFPVTAISDGAIRIVADWRTGREVWYRPGNDAYRARVYAYPSAEPKRGEHAVDVFFRRDRVKVYAYPGEDAKFTTLDAGPSHPATPRQRSAYKVLARHGDFIQVGGADPEESLKPIGWIRIRDDSGGLAVWPAWRDDC